MNAESDSNRRLRIFAAGAAHVDRRGRCFDPFIVGASNPGTLREAPGGAMFNAVRALRRLDVEVTLVSARGGDRDGTTVRDSLEALGIADLALTWLDRHTPTYTALLDDNGDLVGGLADMALYDRMQPRLFQRRHWRAAQERSDALLLDANFPAASIAKLARSAGGRPVTAIGVSPAKAGRLAEALPHLTAVFLSRPEAAALAGVDPETPVATIAGRLLELGCHRAVITAGAQPAAILDEGEIGWQRPVPVDRIRDVTGAGDTLAGVASFALASGQSFLTAARQGMAAASLHISAGRDESGATLSEIERQVAAMPPVESHPES